MRLLPYLTLSLALCLTSVLRAAEPTKAIDYTATMKGVVCSACKEHVTVALKKLPGVETVSFAKGDKEDTAVVTFNSTAPALTKQDAVKALGEDAQHYEVVTLEKAR
jgi:copper chaperone CopZ